VMILGFLVSVHAINKCPFRDLFSAAFSALSCILSVTSLFEMASKCCVEVPSNALKHEKNMICLTEKIHVQGRLCSGMSSSAVGCEFNVNKTICSKQGVFKWRRT